MTDEDMYMISLMHQAVESKYGLVVHCTDPFRFRARLYQVRALSRLPEFAQLKFRTAPTGESPNEIWISKK